ncbi:MAG: sensor histidine kinase [Myxococcales bacterium]|jgi:two-component system nitrogen regulation sensor histidine kinase NtrY
MRLRYQLVLLTAVSTLPFVVAMPWALQEVQSAFDRELDGRLDGAERSARAALGELEAQVQRAVRDLAMDPAVEDIARSVHTGHLDRAELVPAGERLMVLAGLDALEILDSEGRILTSGHLPARAGDPDPAALELASARPQRSAPSRIEVRAPTGIAPALAILAARPVDYGSSRIYILGGRIVGEAWARRLSELTGVEVSVFDSERELARTGHAALPRTRAVSIGEGSGRIGAVQVEVSGAGIHAAKARIVRGAAILWAGLLGIAMALGLALAGRIARPVGALARGARAIAGGELGHQVQVRASGEIAEMVEAFNAMSRDLQSTTERAAMAERVAAWQGVARRLAHEIKNPLTPIRMSIETLLAAHRARRPDFDEIFLESSRAVLEEVERLRRIVDEFSRFARLPKPQLAEVDLAELASTVLSLYSSPLGGIRIERELEPGLLVQADRDQVTQVLINLVTNAEQAMPQGGCIRVRALAVGEAQAALEVQDEGPGVRPEERAGIFEPYFTTKEGGTGLGLAIALRIAQEHGGRLEELGQGEGGARFRLTLPRTRPAALAG